MTPLENNKHHCKQRNGYNQQLTAPCLLMVSMRAAGMQWSILQHENKWAALDERNYSFVIHVFTHFFWHKMEMLTWKQEMFAECYNEPSSKEDTWKKKRVTTHCVTKKKYRKPRDYNRKTYYNFQPRVNTPACLGLQGFVFGFSPGISMYENITNALRKNIQSGTKFILHSVFNFLRPSGYFTYHHF